MGYQAIVMAGGKGSRLPLSKSRPKPNVYVGGDRVMYHVFRNLERGGVDKVVVPVQYKASHITGAMRREYKGERLEPEAKSPFEASGDVLGSSYNGTADCVQKTKQFLDGNPRIVLVTSADVLTNIEIGELIEAHRHYAEKGAWATFASVLMPRGTLHRYGVVIKDKHDRVERFLEKPTNYHGDMGEINASFYVFDRKMLNLLDEEAKRRGDVKDEKPEEFDFGRHVFPALARDGKLFSHLFGDSYWKDIGVAEEYIRANLDMIDGIPGIESPLRKDEETHCLVGKACKMHNSLIRNSVIGNYVSIRHSSIENSVLVGDNDIFGTDLKFDVVDRLSTVHNSTIGKYVILGRDVHVEPGSEIADGVNIDPGAIIKKSEMGRIVHNVIREYRQKE